MANSKIDSRQTKNRAILDQLSNGPNIELDDQLNSINAELISPFRIKRDTSLDIGDQRVIHVEASSISNPIHGRNHSIRPIRYNSTTSKIPDFASGIISVDKVAQTLSISPGFPSTIILPAPVIGSIQYLKILVQINLLNSGTLIVSVGTWNTNKASASFSSIATDAYVVGYIVLSTDINGVIQDPSDSDIYQFVGQDIIDQHNGTDITLDTSNFSNIVLPNSSSADTVQKAFDYIDDHVVAKSPSATDNAIVRYDGTTGQTIQNSSATIDDDGSINSVGLKITEVALDPSASPNQMILFAKNTAYGHRAFLKDPNSVVIPLGVGSIPVGGVIAIMPNLVGAYNCTATITADANGFVVCGGQTINDSSSPMNGAVVPNINNDMFLMGNNTAGLTGGSNSIQSHAHSIPAMNTASSGSHSASVGATTASGTATYSGGVSGSISGSATINSGVSVSVADHGPHTHIYLNAHGLPDGSSELRSFLNPAEVGGYQFVGRSIDVYPTYTPPGFGSSLHLDKATADHLPGYLGFYRGDLSEHNLYTRYNDQVLSHSASGSISTTAPVSGSITGGSTSITVNFANATISSPTVTVLNHVHNIPASTYNTGGITSTVDSRPIYISVKYIMRVR